MTLSNEAVEEEEVPESPEPNIQAEAHAQRARSLTSALPSSLPRDDAESLPGLPELVREWLQGPAGWLQKRGAAFTAREFDVIHGPPPTLARMHERHRVAASHWDAAIIRKPRAAWGLLHITLAAALYAVLDALFSPVGALITALSVYISIHFWL
jgi:hypothetical protein